MASLRDQVVDFQEPGVEELLWLEACCEDSLEDDNHVLTKKTIITFIPRHRDQLPSSGRKQPSAPQPPLLPSPPHWKGFSKADQKPKHPTNWAAGGPGMQAVFLDSSQRSCGTGVFLPRTAGTVVEKPRKPGTNTTQIKSSKALPELKMSSEYSLS
ncbi:hypothetical protein Tco_0373934 [Tanacetum coccineum]